MRILVTGAAGFIGFHVVGRLLKEGHSVLGIDDLNDYYDVELKHARLDRLGSYDAFEFEQFGVEDDARLLHNTLGFRADRFIHFAAQAGVRFSVSNPEVFLKSNIVGFQSVLEACRKSKIRHLIYSSSSSVYGLNAKTPFKIEDHASHPVNIYAATKRANELMAHSYSHLYGLPTTGLRFFSVYGPFGRPDMAPALFTDAVLNGRPIKVFNYGRMKRDFTYIDDVVESVVRVMDHIPTAHSPAQDGNFKPGESSCPYRLFNVGNGKPVALMDFVRAIEIATELKADVQYEPLQPGEVLETFADTSGLQQAIGFVPSTSIQEGMNRFVAWYRDFYSVGELTAIP